MSKAFERKGANDTPNYQLVPMRRAFLLAVLLVASNMAGCAAVALVTADPSTWKPGQVLSDKATEIGNGYREVARSQVNPPEHWEAVGHFVFVYFKDKQLCQCSASEIAFAPA